MASSRAYPISLLIISIIPLSISGLSTLLTYSCDSTQCFPMFRKLAFLSTAVIVFTLVFLYTSKPVPFLYNLPTTTSSLLLQRRLYTTILGCTIALIIIIIISFIIAVDLGFLISVFMLFFAMHGYIIYLYYLTNRVLAVERASGFLTNRLESLKGNTRIATLLVFVFSAISGAIRGFSLLGFLATVNTVGLWCCSRLCFNLGWDILERG